MFGFLYHVENGVIAFLILQNVEKVTKFMVVSCLDADIEPK